MSEPTTLTALYLRAGNTWRGLRETPVVSMTDAEIRGQFAAILRGLERDVLRETTEISGETAAKRALTRRWLLRHLPQLREARQINWAAFALLVAELVAERQRPTLAAAE